MLVQGSLECSGNSQRQSVGRTDRQTDSIVTLLSRSQIQVLWKAEASFYLAVYFIQQELNNLL